MSNARLKDKNISCVCRESLVNRVLLVLLVTAALLDQLGLLDLVDLLGSLVERSGTELQ